jgi:hypothetical protein
MQESKEIDGKLALDFPHANVGDMLADSRIFAPDDLSSFALESSPYYKVNRKLRHRHPAARNQEKL